MANKINQLYGIKYPIIQGGMVWNSSWRLAAAVSEAGGLGLIGAASMYPEVLRVHIQKCRRATQMPFGVNIPLLYPDIDQLMKVVFEENVQHVFTSAGNPGLWTTQLKDKGITVTHVVSSSKFAIKAEQVGADAVVAEGFEAGGHNGREETTTLCLIPQVREAVSLPLLAAGGIASGKAMLAAMILGADGVQIGTRFAASAEASGHDNFKNKIVSIAEGDTQLSLKKLVPVRLIKNAFFNKVSEAEAKGASEQELAQLLGHARAKVGMFEGDMEEGELEIGQVSAMINEIMPAGEIINRIIEELYWSKEQMAKINL
jgi:enoyl-[acyl-carrier protein] reductase II